MKTAKLIRRHLRATGQARTREEFRSIVRQIDHGDHAERGERRARVAQLTKLLGAFK